MFSVAFLMHTSKNQSSIDSLTLYCADAHQSALTELNFQFFIFPQRKNLLFLNFIYILTFAGFRLKLDSKTNTRPFELIAPNEHCF